MIFKRGVYASALRHLAPVAQRVAGTQAVPLPGPDVRGGFSRSRQRPRAKPLPEPGRDGGGTASN